MEDLEKRVTEYIEETSKMSDLPLSLREICIAAHAYKRGYRDRENQYLLEDVDDGK